MIEAKRGTERASAMRNNSLRLLSATIKENKNKNGNDRLLPST
jgi:hypothetical protein